MVYLMSDFCQVMLANFLRRVNFANSPYLNLKTAQNYGILLIVNDKRNCLIFNKKANIYAYYLGGKK